jgi:hypothetical protein
MVGYQKNTKIMNTILKDDKKLEVETESQMGATQGTENRMSELEIIDSIKEIQALAEDLCFDVELLKKTKNSELFQLIMLRANFVSEFAEKLYKQYLKQESEENK